MELSQPPPIVDAHQSPTDLLIVAHRSSTIIVATTSSLFGPEKSWMWEESRWKVLYSEIELEANLNLCPFVFKTRSTINSDGFLPSQHIHVKTYGSKTFWVQNLTRIQLQTYTHFSCSGSTINRTYQSVKKRLIKSYLVIWILFQVWFKSNSSPFNSGIFLSYFLGNFCYRPCKKIPIACARVWTYLL